MMKKLFDNFPFINNSKNEITELKELKECSDGKCVAIYSYIVDNKEY